MIAGNKFWPLTHSGACPAAGLVVGAGAASSNPPPGLAPRRRPVPFAHWTRHIAAFLGHGVARCSRFSAVALATLSGSLAMADDTKPARPDKSGYHLFNPTPAALMRELSADRPDKTESTFTVDAGHFQVEMDFVNLSYDRHNIERDQTSVSGGEAAPMNLKLGLLNNLDAQLTFTSHAWERVADRAAGTVERHSGFGDITPRLKWNVAGNDGGLFSLALLPFVKIPTGPANLGNGAVEGGLKAPYAFDLPGFELGLQTEVDFFRDGSGGGYHTEWVNSISVGRPIWGKLSGYVEFYSSVSTERGQPWLGTFDTWLTWQVNENWRLDAGVYIGATRSADDWHPFIGMTWRH